MSKLSKFKVVLVGDQNVGKTSIISRFIHDSFQFTSNPTVGIDFVTKTLQISGSTLRLQLWDTAGQQRFRSLIPSYVRDADACLIVLDVSQKLSFEGVDRWIDFVKESRGGDAMVVLVGNKSDIEEREVGRKQIEEYATKMGYPYVEVSAKNGSNIQTLFLKISSKLIEDKVGKEVSVSNQAQNKSSKSVGSKDPTITLQKNKVAAENKQQCQC